MLDSSSINDIKAEIFDSACDSRDFFANFIPAWFTLKFLQLETLSIKALSISKEKIYERSIGSPFEKHIFCAKILNELVFRNIELLFSHSAFTFRSILLDESIICCHEFKFDNNHRNNSKKNGNCLIFVIIISYIYEQNKYHSFVTNYCPCGKCLFFLSLLSVMKTMLNNLIFSPLNGE